MRLCRACGFPEHGLMRCEVAARIRQVQPVANTALQPVANAVPVANKSRYADPVKRREYMRVLMANRRAAAKGVA